MTTPITPQYERIIVLNKEYANLVPDLSAGEFETLKQSIIQNRLYYAIIMNQHGVILDGYQRYKACQESGKKPNFIVKYFDDQLLEQKFRIEANLNRKHLTPFQRIELKYKLEIIENEIGKATNRMSEGGKIGAEKRWAESNNNEIVPQPNHSRVVQNCTTPLNQIKKRMLH